MSTTFKILSPTVNDHLDDNEGTEGIDRLSHGEEFEGFLRLHWLTFTAVEGDRNSRNTVRTPL
jgi:hypothetical protein